MAAGSGPDDQTGEGVGRDPSSRPTKPPKYPQKQKSPTGNTNTYYTNEETIATKKLKTEKGSYRLCCGGL